MLANKPNYRTPQKALEYALYQTISSHFKNGLPRVGNERLRVPAGFWNEKVEVTFHKRKNDNIAEIIFHGENTALCVAGIWGRNEHHFIDPMVFKRAA